MKTVFKLKDLVKYIVFIGVVYALFKLIPSQPFNQRDLILIVSVISFGFIFIDCYSRTEGFATMEESGGIAKPLITSEFREIDEESIVGDFGVDDAVNEESDAVNEESDAVNEESDAVDEDSDAVNEESETVQEESKTVQEKSKTVQEKSKTVQEKSKVVQEDSEEDEEDEEDDEESDVVEEENKIQPRANSKPTQRTNKSNVQSVLEGDLEDDTESNPVDLNVNSKYEKLRQEYYNSKQRNNNNSNQQNNNNSNQQNNNNSNQENTIMNKYQNVLNKTNSTNDLINNKVTSVISNNSEQQRFQEAPNIAASNATPQAAGCGVEMEKLKRQISQHIGELEDKIKSFENQPINENMEKYKNYLMKDLAEVGVLDQIDIDNLNSKLDNNVMTINEAISKLENLKLRSKPRAKLNKAKNESDYNELPSDFYDPLGDPQLSQWDTAFHMLNTNKWQVPMPRPPVCINTSPCKVCPEVDDTNSNSLRLKDWDYARKVMNLTINKDWANDQMDTNTSIPLNVNPKTKEKKVYQYDDMISNQESGKPHPPLKTGGLIPYYSDQADKSTLPSLNNVRRKVTSKNKMQKMASMPKTAQVQSFRNVDKSNEYVRKYKERFD